MNVQTLTPEDQIANVERALEELWAGKRHSGRANAIRAAEAQLDELRTRHERGELRPIVDDDAVPF